VSSSATVSMAAAGGVRGKGGRDREGRRYNRDSDQTRQMTLPQGRGRVEKQVSHENLQMKEENTSNHHADFIDPPIPQALGTCAAWR
jgi:hypothetical protein